MEDGTWTCVFSSDPSAKKRKRSDHVAFLGDFLEVNFAILNFQVFEYFRTASMYQDCEYEFAMVRRTSTYAVGVLTGTAVHIAHADPSKILHIANGASPQHELQR